MNKALQFARKAHKGQKQVSGKPYVDHPIAVASLLKKYNQDTEVIVAGLLHDVVEDTSISIEKVRESFGDEIAKLVEGLTKIDKIHFESREDYNAENIRKVLLATADDIRVMLIKLADRLHNMRTLKDFREDKQRRISKETLEIYASIAHKLGVWRIKGELEDLSLRYLEPDVYHFLREKISGKREEREKITEMITDKIKKSLDEKGITARVNGRAKYFFSIYRKMKKKNLDVDEIYDLIAIRIITKQIADCYAALGAVHDLWRPMPHRFKDYISVPKANGYQSLHTTLITGGGKMLEVQIRTEDMHHLAEEGVAAHWRYQGTERDKQFDRKIAWLKQILDWKTKSNDATDFIETLKIDLFHDEIVVFTPKGDPISLPRKSTPIDFAYAVHTTIGNHCSKSKVNNRLMPLDTELKSGDIIEIMTQKNASPSRQWLKFVKTGKARSKIRSVLNIVSDLDPKKGRILAEKKLKGYEGKIEDMIIFSGKKSLLKISKCCSPKFGEPIVGFYTKDKKVTIHKADCSNVHALANSKKAKVSWKKDAQEDVTTIIMTIDDRIGLMVDVLNIISAHRVNIKTINTKSKKDYVINKIGLQTKDIELVKKIISKIRSVNGIKDVKKA